MEELITNDTPDLVDHWPNDRRQVPVANWNGARSTWSDTDDSPSPWHTGNGGFDTSAYPSSFVGNVTAISGRDPEEENLWWDASVRKKCARPGPGILPPLLTEEIHNSEHTLLSVVVSQPDIPREIATSSSSRETHTNDNTPSRTSSPQPNRPLSPPPPPPPTSDELRTAIPHPNAYYCRKHNGWVLIVWKSSSVVPSLARSFQNTDHLPLPDQSRRREINSCIDDGGPSFRPINKTHHLHLYQKAVDAHNLTPPFRRSMWEKDGKMKEKRRQGTISMEEFDIEKLGASSADDMLEEDREEEGDLLDLYICCQCSFYCLASGVIPGVIPPKFMEEFTKEKYEHPPIGKTGESSVSTAWDTVIQYVDILIRSFRFHLNSTAVLSRTNYGEARIALLVSPVTPSRGRLAGALLCA
jgi:ubiquitin carboxyl-terminal hydrolase 25/28